MPKKLTILGALTVALVVGYFGVFNTTNTEGALQSFSIAGVTEIDWTTCFEDGAVGTDYPVTSGGRVVCNAGNVSPTALVPGANYVGYSIINLPRGNRLTLPVTFTPSDAGEWDNQVVGCTPAAPPDNGCTAATPTGTVTARSDIGCNDVGDILTTLAGGPPSWPPDYADTFGFTRTGASVANGGGGELGGTNPNAYIHQIVPFPSTWTFASSDTALLDNIWLAGVISNPIAPVSRLQTVVYESSFAGQTGLTAAVSLLGGAPDGVTTDNTQLCLDSPQDSIGTLSYLKAPAAAIRLPRWTILTSDLDDGDSTIDRILDWECNIIGSPADGGDADADCDPDPSDSADADKDADDDGVPDGVERALGSDPTDTDSDNDGADDWTELFEFTDPLDTDTDDDLQADKPDDIPTNGSETADQTDATDDNCPNVPNGAADGDPDTPGVQVGQLNTDSLRQFHGMGTGTGDATNPNEDAEGDACDTDDDNDGLGDVAEAVMTIQGWGGYTTAPTSVCAGPGVGSAPDTTMLLKGGDTDRDYVLDGRECAFRSRPDVSIRSGAGAGAMNCGTSGTPVPVAPVVFADGCAQPGSNASGAGGGDADSDGLFKPGDAGAHAGLFGIEPFYRTTFINNPAGGQFLDIDGDGSNGEADRDSDRDTLGLALAGVSINDGNEVKIYGTNPASTDSDQDGCPDGDEIIDMNGDGNTNSGDQGLLASRFSASPLDNAPANGEIDDYTDLDVDLNKDASLSSGDQGLLAAAISAAGTCSPYVEDNIDVGRITKGLP